METKLNMYKILLTLSILLFSSIVSADTEGTIQPYSRYNTTIITTEWTGFMIIKVYATDKIACYATVGSKVIDNDNEGSKECIIAVKPGMLEKEAFQLNIVNLSDKPANFTYNIPLK